jgi:hypothetical protein
VSPAVASPRLAVEGHGASVDPVRTLIAAARQAAV